MVRRGLLGALFPFVIAGAAGCGSSSPTAPVADPTVVSDTFTGTINPLGTDSHTFTVGYAGGTSNASVTVVALATVANQTPQTITIGVGFGSLNQGVCTAALTIPAAAVGAELATTSSPFLAGAYCVLVFDNPAAPTVTEPLTYTIKVNHF